MLDNILLGFETALSLQNLFYSFVGVFIGNLIGVLPGIGALAAISMLLPITYGLDPAGALMMLAGLYYGTSYGGATTIHEPSQVQQLLALGASAVQLGSAFAVTAEGDAHDNFKRVLVEAEPEDIVTFMSVAGLPARAVRTPWLDAYLHKEPKLQQVAKSRDCSEGFDCLAFCGLRDGVAKSGQFCIDRQLAYALAGDVARGLFFRGSEPLPLGKVIAPVKDLVDYLLSALHPSGSQPSLT